MGPDIPKFQYNVGVGVGTPKVFGGNTAPSWGSHCCF